MNVKLHLLNFVEGCEKLVVICLAKKFPFIDTEGFMTVPFFRIPLLDSTLNQLNPTYVV